MITRRASGLANIVHAGRRAVERGFAFHAGSTAMARIVIGEALEVIGIGTDVADVPGRIAGHLAGAVDTLGLASHGRIAGRTARAAMGLIVVRVTVESPAIVAEMVVVGTFVRALVVDAQGVTTHRIGTADAGCAAIIRITVLMAGKVAVAKMLV